MRWRSEDAKRFLGQVWHVERFLTRSFLSLERMLWCVVAAEDFPAELEMDEPDLAEQPNKAVIYWNKPPVIHGCRKARGLSAASVTRGSALPRESAGASKPGRDSIAIFPCNAQRGTVYIGAWELPGFPFHRPQNKGATRMAKRLSTMTLAELRAEINRRQQGLPKLRKERAKLTKQLGAIDRKIAALVGEPSAPARAPKAPKPAEERRLPRNAKSLIECAADVLAKAKDGMRVKDVMAAVKKAGYKTNSKSFYGLVAAALQDNRFGKLGRGVYTLKGQKKAAKRGRKKAAEQEAPAKAEK